MGETPGGESGEAESPNGPSAASGRTGGRQISDKRVVVSIPLGRVPTRGHYIVSPVSIAVA